MIWKQGSSTYDGINSALSNKITPYVSESECIAAQKKPLETLIYLYVNNFYHSQLATHATISDAQVLAESYDLIYSCAILSIDKRDSAEYMKLSRLVFLLYWLLYFIEEKWAL